MKLTKIKAISIAKVAFFCVLTFLLLNSGILYLSSETFAQPRPPKDPKFKERMGLIKKMKLLETLNFTDEAKSEKFLVKYNSFEKKIEENRTAMKVASKELDEAIQNNSKDIATKTKNILALQEEGCAISVDKMKSMSSILSEPEYAKYVQFENVFMRDLFGMFMEGKHKKDFKGDFSERKIKKKNNKKKNRKNKNSN